MDTSLELGDSKCEEAEREYPPEYREAETGSDALPVSKGEAFKFQIFIL